MGECRRIFNIRILLIIAGMTALNIFLFTYQAIGGKSFSQIMFEKEQREYLIDKYSGCDAAQALRDLRELENQLCDGEQENQQYDYEEISAYYEQFDSSEKEWFMEVLKEIKNQASYADNYSGYIQGIINNAQQMQNFAVFSDKGSFSYANIKKTEHDYSRVADLELGITNNRAVEEFTAYYYTFYISAAAVLFIIYRCFEERDNGLWELVHSTKNGRKGIAFIRLAIITFGSLAVTALLYLSAFIVSVFVYGWPELSSPVQSIESYKKFTYLLSQGQVILFNLVFSWLAILSISMILWLLFTICRVRNVALVLTGIITGTEIFLYQNIKDGSVYEVFKKVNIIRFFKINEDFCSYANIGSGQFIITVFQAVMICVFAVIAVSGTAAVAAGICMRPSRKTSWLEILYEKMWSAYQRIFMYIPMLGKEFHKLLISSRGIVVIAAILAVSFYLTGTGLRNFTENETVKEKIYLEQGGQEYSQIIDMVEQRRNEYEEASIYLQQVQEGYGRGEIDFNDLMSVSNYAERMKAQYAALKEFEDKAAYLRELSENKNIDGYMMSDRGYNEIFGERSAARESFLLIALVSGVMLIVSESFILEYSTGMKNIIKSSSKGWKRIFAKKLIVGVLIAALVYFMVYAIDLISLYLNYGMPFMEAPVQSLTFMEGCKWKVSIFEYIVIRQSAKFIFTEAAAVVSMLISAFIAGKRNKAFVSLTIVIADIIAVALINAGLL